MADLLRNPYAESETHQSTGLSSRTAKAKVKSVVPGSVQSLIALTLLVLWRMQVQCPRE